MIELFSSADRFWEIFQQEWANYYEQDSESIVRDYDEKKYWTERMLGNEGFLKHVSTQYMQGFDHPRLAREWYTIDLMGLCWKENEDYTKASVYFVLEHENGQDVETEIWKLAHFRAPLKILVFYSYRRSRPEWLKGKIKELAELKRRVDALNGGAKNSEYLLIVGDFGRMGPGLFRRYFLDHKNDSMQL